jgi:hypothetical protein
MEPEEEVERADRETDRELVETDGDPEREQNKTLAAYELVDPLVFGLLLVEEHPEPEQGEHADREIVGAAADEISERGRGVTQRSASPFRSWTSGG